MADRQALLESVLESPAQQDAFVEFCKKNHCAENLLFYRSICEFEEAATDEERLTKACVIVAQYVKPLSPLEANMPDARRASLAATVKSGSAPRNLFEGEKAAAFKDMMRDTLPRFVKDPLYREAVKLSTQAVVHASKRYEDCLTRLRKRKFLGLKLKQRHTKADLRAFASLGSDMRSGVLKEGFLMKRGDNHQSWKRRWCILSHIGFGYFLDEYRFAPKGAVLAHEMLSVTPTMDEELDMRFTLGIVTASRTYVIQAANDRDRKRWVNALQSSIDKPVMVAVDDDASDAGVASGAGAGVDS